jgi:hypothetical protein
MPETPSFYEEGEVLPPALRIRDLLTLSEEQKNEFRNRVQQFNGVIQITIHPFFHEQVEVYVQPGVESAGATTQAISDKLNKLLKLPVDKTPPVIIFESYQHIADLPGKLDSTLQESNNIAYTVTTRINDATPVNDEANIQQGNYSEENKRLDLDEEKRRWENLSNILLDLGVKNIILGGQQLTATPSIAPPL